MVRDPATGEEKKKSVFSVVFLGQQLKQYVFLVLLISFAASPADTTLYP